MLVFVLLILFVGLLYGLWRYHRQSDSLSRSVFLGLFLGVIYGLVISSLGLDTESFLP